MGIRTRTPQQMGEIVVHYKIQVLYVPVRPFISFHFISTFNPQFAFVFSRTRSVFTTVLKQGPDHPCVLGGDGNRCAVATTPSLRSLTHSMAGSDFRWTIGTTGVPLWTKKSAPSTTSATTAVAVLGPTPQIFAGSWQTSLSRKTASICWSKYLIFSLICSSKSMEDADDIACQLGDIHRWIAYDLRYRSLGNRGRLWDGYTTLATEAAHLRG